MRAVLWGCLFVGVLAVGCGSEGGTSQAGAAGAGGAGAAGGAAGAAGSTGGALPEGPLTAPSDPVRCLLPWPSSRFLAADAASPTGLRVELDPTSLPITDPLEGLQGASGFSVVSPLMVGVPGSLDGPATDTTLRLFVNEPDRDDHGTEVRLRHDVVDSVQSGEQLVVGYPRRPMAPATAHVAVGFTSGDLVPSPEVEVILGLRPAEGRDEQALFAYHEPTRQLLERVGVDVATVARVWDFTTRSRTQALSRTRSMREAAIARVDSGSVTVAIDSVEFDPAPDVQAIVIGRLVGLPDFPTSWSVGDVPQTTGDREAPFRVMIPTGSGDYPLSLYGHGLGGSYDEDTFDSLFAGAGVAKLGVSFYGFGLDAASTLTALIEPFSGSNAGVALLQQSVADISALRRSLDTVLGAALSGPELGGQANPAVGRRPDTTIPLWIGGSLGGTMGLTLVSADPDLRYGVLNVPGAAWTHFSAFSLPFKALAGLIRLSAGSDLDVRLITGMAQNIWDPIDGAVWVGAPESQGDVFLIQESMGDPILPNIGTDIIATATDAAQVGAVLSPIPGLETASLVEEASAITQYRVDSTDDLDIHGFGAKNEPPGDAAREQIEHFLRSALAGKSEIIVPTGCPAQSCDFTQ